MWMGRWWAARRWKPEVLRTLLKIRFKQPMSFFIGFLTVVLVLDSLLLILLVLIQLPKKEAGAGVAFGGGATDALFGAGSGNALTKITKYAATVFFSLALIISILYAKTYPKDDTELRKKIAAAAAAAAAGQGAT